VDTSRTMEVKCLYCDKIIREEKRPILSVVRDGLDFCDDECKSRYFEELEHNDEATINEVLRHLKIAHDLTFKIDDFENRGIAFRNIVRAIDAFETPRLKDLAFDHYKQDIKEQVIDAEPDELIRCDDCGNDEKFYVCMSPLWMKMEKGTNAIIELTGETRIHKPDDVFIICRKCNKIILESCMY